jgi:hypothetical protein
MLRSATCVILLLGACTASPASSPDATPAPEPIADAGPPGPSLETDLGGGELALRNASAACDQTPWTWAASPDPGERGWFVSRITPAHVPFAVDRIHYQLYDRDPCRTQLPFRLRLARGPGVTPPAVPTVLYEATITPPAIVGDAKLTPLVETLPTPIELHDGDSLFVMFEVIQQGDWNGAQVDPPIAWTLLEAGAARPATLDVQVDGHRI